MNHVEPRVHLVSLGCPKNWVDSEIILGRLHRAGYLPVPEPDEADLIVVNTCAFIQAATEESLQTVLEVAKWKEVGRCRRLIVTGCLPQRYGDELFELLPEVDLLLGPGEVPRVVERLLALEKDGARACYRGGLSYLNHENDPRILTLQTPTAYVKIADGCSNRCSYCTVPGIRGPLRSRSLASVIREVQQWVEKGVKEIILVAQDTTAFGLDGSDTGDLPALLRALDQVDGLEWVRIMYAHPARVTAALVEAMAEGSRICPYLDLPIQHINTAILKQMNRRTEPEEIRRVIRQLREAVPGIHLRTSVIVGFPGETESAFQELLDFVEEIRFEWLGAFAYSREENTAAATLGPEISEKVIQDRLSRLMECQQAITGDLMKQWVRREVRVLVGRKVATNYGEAVGRTSFQAPDIDGVIYLKGQNIIPGRIQSAYIIDSLDYDLIGEIQDVA